MTNSFWSLPQSVRDDNRPVGKTLLSIMAYKEDGLWYFDLPPITHKEMLVFTEALDELAKGESTVALSITTYEVPGAQEVRYVCDDPDDSESSEYSWNGHLIWLCPWLQWYFGEKPKTMWFKVDS